MRTKSSPSFWSMRARERVVLPEPISPVRTAISRSSTAYWRRARASSYWGAM